MNRIRSKLVLGNRNQLLTLNTERRVCATHTNYRNILTGLYCIFYMEYLKCSYGNAMKEDLKVGQVPLFLTAEDLLRHKRVLFLTGFMTGLFTAVIIYLAILML